MLGEPKARVAELFGPLGKVDAAAQGLRRRRSRRDRNKVEYCQRCRHERAEAQALPSETWTLDETLALMIFSKVPAPKRITTTP